MSDTDYPICSLMRYLLKNLLGNHARDLCRWARQKRHLPTASSKEGNNVWVIEAVKPGNVGLELSFILQANGRLPGQLDCNLLVLPDSQIDLREHIRI